MLRNLKISLLLNTVFSAHCFLGHKKGWLRKWMSRQNDNIFSSMIATLNEPEAEEINKIESTNVMNIFY